MGFLIAFFLTNAVFVYLIILGASKSKTKKDIEREDDEQIIYLEDWREKNEQKKAKKCKKI